MLSTPLLKLPLLFSGGILLHKATFAPNPPPKPDAVARFTQRDTIARIVNLVPTINMAVTWTVTLAEAAVILAQTEHISTPMLSYLTFGRPSLSRQLGISPLFAAGWALAAFGSTIRILCFRHLGRQFTYNLSIVDDHKLITNGPYAIVRHPSYTGWMSLAVGSVLMLVAPGSWLAESEVLRSVGGRVAISLYAAFQAYIIAMLFPRMKREDEALKAQFGDEWVEWTKRTPYRLIPGIY
ncbi:hypothetical protein BN946_scf184884.g8 [Trametes cinnabarina]|uniref:Protein-S-isoprenylcysteine O-methyltransferase n=1 Tax=Pycnoporus cinnabarinus TaxID=5643 RepID=A0A060SC57_PYCCI|nr:hypothetical protein BN946_scf184884.g8 [Trametes cinnabarina]